MLTASLPKLEPYSPLNDTEFHNSSYMNYEGQDSLLQSSNDIQGTGKDEFLRRQSLFVSSNGRQSGTGISTAAKKRLSHDVSNTTKRNETIINEQDSTIIPGIAMHNSYYKFIIQYYCV